MAITFTDPSPKPITFTALTSCAVPYRITHIEPRPSFGASQVAKLPASVYFCPWCGLQAVLCSTDADHTDAPHKGCPCPTLLKVNGNTVRPGVAYFECPIG